MGKLISRFSLNVSRSRQFVRPSHLGNSATKGETVSGAKRSTRNEKPP